MRALVCHAYGPIDSLRLEDVPKPSNETIAKLDTARLDLVEKALREQYGIPANQIGRANPPPPEPAEGDPSVRVELGSARR